MSRYYDKDQLKNQLELENIFDLFMELGGEPEYNDTGLVASTICHNPPGVGSRKLYYYENSHLCRCYTSCDSDGAFDIFELIIKVMKIQKGYDWQLYDAMSYVANFFGIAGVDRVEKHELADWGIIQRYLNLADKTYTAPTQIQLPTYNPLILTKFIYPRILDWEQENILPEVTKRNLIGYYPGSEQITIPHFDIDGRLVGIRGRFLGENDASRFGKYRPLHIGKTWYTHPLSMNLYGLNKNKENIKRSKTAIILESEKSVLQLESFYGQENNIAVACCGSSISSYQIDLLVNLGVQEIVIGFDRQFQEISDDEFIRLKKRLQSIYHKYNNKVKVTAIFDKRKITPYKASPSDLGKDIFEKLLNERIIPK